MNFLNFFRLFNWEFLGAAPTYVRRRISIIPPRQQFVKRKVIQNNLFILSRFRHFANRLFKAYLVYYIMSGGNGEFPSDRKKLSEIENFLLTKPLRCDIMRVQKREKATVNTTAAHESDVRLSRQNLPRGVLLLRDINVNQQLPFAGRQRLIGWQKKFKLGIDKSQGL